MTRFFISLMACFSLFTVPASRASEMAGDETMLMFVGENLEAVTAASRVPESPSLAPAVVKVITRQEIEKHNYRTLADLLAFEEGFYISKRNGGSLPYFRGLPESLLLLYNGIPMPTGGTRNIHPLDLELSLDNARQVEIIKGPGSVLWGADAFAGIINIVPLAAKDVDSGHVRVSGGSDHYREGYGALGLKFKHASAFISARAAESRYHDKNFFNYSRDSQVGILSSPAEVDNSDYKEIIANGSVGRWVNFFARYSDFTREYTIFEDASELKWNGTRHTPVSSFGLSAARESGPYHLKLSGYYQNLAYQTKDINTEYQEDLNQYFCELLWDYRMLKKGLFTAGVSYKESRVSGALATSGFEPGEVPTPSPIFVQDIDQANYNTTVTSAFSQYRHKFKNLQLWAGIRLDDHSETGSNTTWNLGANWYASNLWRLKAVLGTAYRTPYSQQIAGDNQRVSDEIDSLSLELSFVPSPNFKASLTPFYNAIDGYVSSDPNAGVSGPVSRKIYGGELALKFICKPVDVHVNLSKTASSGDNYRFTVVDSQELLPDGTVHTVYTTWEESFDTSPGFMFKSGIHWRITSELSLWTDISYTAPVPYSFSQDTVDGEHDSFWLAGTGIRITSLGLPNSCLTLSVTNIFNTTYTYSGFYGSVPGRSRTFGLSWSVSW